VFRRPACSRERMGVAHSPRSSRTGQSKLPNASGADPPGADILGPRFDSPDLVGDSSPVAPASAGASSRRAVRLSWRGDRGAARCWPCGLPRLYFPTWWS